MAKSGLHAMLAVLQAVAFVCSATASPLMTSITEEAVKAEKILRERPGTISPADLDRLLSPDYVGEDYLGVRSTKGDVTRSYSSVHTRLAMVQRSANLPGPSIPSAILRIQETKIADGTIIVIGSYTVQSDTHPTFAFRDTFRREHGTLKLLTSKESIPV